MKFNGNPFFYYLYKSDLKNKPTVLSRYSSIKLGNCEQILTIQGAN